MIYYFLGFNPNSVHHNLNTRYHNTDKANKKKEYSSVEARASGVLPQKLYCCQ